MYGDYNEMDPEKYASMNTEDFIDYFEVDSGSHFHVTILAIYYTFTTLSTVGFGDLHPRSNPERILMVFIFIFGNAIFSLILGNFIAIIDQAKDYMNEYEEYYNLKKFFSTLKEQYNNGVSINNELNQ
jgi:hypothetical protein